MYSNMKGGSHVSLSKLHSHASSQSPQSPSRPWLAGWRMEILAMVISMGCTVGVVAFLAHWQNRPLSDWKVSWLSLTAILSILATLFEFTTLYAVSNAISQCKWA